MCFSSNFVRGAVFVVVVASAANLNLKGARVIRTVSAGALHFLGLHPLCPQIVHGTLSVGKESLSSIPSGSCTYTSFFISFKSLLGPIGLTFTGFRPEHIHKISGTGLFTFFCQLSYSMFSCSSPRWDAL
jgi:hypothetical protein